MRSDATWRRNALIVGGVIGAVVGVVAASLLVREAEENENQEALTAGKGFQIGMLVLGLLRQITKL
jgi:gas vesicle protein